MARVGDDQSVIAAIRGLMDGGQGGRGIGDRFLGHIERCSVLLHIIDGTSESIGQDYHTVMQELDAYGGGLTDKPHETVLHKIYEWGEEDQSFTLRTLRTGTGGQRVWATT